MVVTKKGVSKFFFILLALAMLFATLASSVSSLSQDDVTLVQNTESCRDNCVLEVKVLVDQDRIIGKGQNVIDYKVKNLKSSAQPIVNANWLLHTWTTTTPVYGSVERSFFCNFTISDTKAKDSFVECYSEVYDAINDSTTKTIYWSGTATKVKDNEIFYDVTEVVSSTTEEYEEWIGQTDQLKDLRLYVDGELFNGNFDDKHSTKSWKKGEEHTIKITGDFKSLNERVDVIPSLFGVDITKFAVWDSSAFNMTAFVNYTNLQGSISGGEGLFYLAKWKQPSNCSIGNKVYNWYLDELSGTKGIDYCGNTNLTLTGVGFGLYSLLGLNYSLDLPLNTGYMTASSSNIDSFGDLTKNWTLLFFYNADTHDTTDDYVVMRDDAAGYSTYVSLNFRSDIPGWRYEADNTTVSTSLLSAGSGAVPTGVWRMYAVKSQSGTIYLYENGVNVASSSSQASVKMTSKQIEFGRSDGGYGADGKFDVITFIDGYAMSNSEIDNWYYDNLCQRLLNGIDCSDIDFYDSTSGQTLNWTRVNMTGLANYSQYLNMTNNVSFDAARVWGINQSTNTSNVKVSLNGTTTLTTNADTNTDLVGWWKLEPSIFTNGQLRDLSGNGKTLTVTGSPVFVQNSSCNHASGNSDLGCYLMTASTTHLNSGNTDRFTAISSCVWAKKTGNGGNGDNDENHETLLSAPTWSNQINLIVRKATDHDVVVSNPSIGFCADSNWTMPDNVWYHLCIVANTTGTYLYINGVLNASGSSCISTNAEIMSYVSGNPVQAIMWYQGYVDDLVGYNRTLSATEVLDLYRHGTHGVPEYYNLSVTFSNVAPSVSTPSWATTGGFTSGSRTFGQVIDYVDAVCVDDSAITGCNITVTDPDGILEVSNAAMSNVSGNVTSATFRYGTDFTLDKAGSWTVNVTAYDASGLTGSNTTTISVATNTLTTIDGYYGFTSNGVLSDNDFASYVSSYSFDLLEISDNITSMNSDWTSIKALINTSYNTNVVTGLNLVLDCNCSNQANVSSYIANINANYPTLLTGIYRTDLVYLSLEFKNQSYTAAEAYNCFNNVSKAVVNATNNQFVVYAKGYNSSGLDSSYITYTPMLYNNQTTQSAMINWEANTTRTKASLNRIYDVASMNSTLLQISKELQENAYKIFRSSVNESTTIVNTSVAELDNYDVVVFNNESSAWMNRSITFKSGSGKDIYDKTYKRLVENNTDLTALVDVAAYGVTYLELDDFDHFQMTSSVVGTLYKATSTAVENFTWSDGSRDAANQVTGSIRRKMYLYDPKFTNSGVVHNYHGWLNASQVQNWTLYDMVVIADKNDAEVDAIINQSTFFGYIEVFDYNQSNATWVADKKAEVDAWLAINPNVNVFYDGIDQATITNATDFETKFRQIIDYVCIDKNLSTGLNTYTYNEEYATWACGIHAFVMKESCVRRWNGTNASSPDSYDWEDWSLELDKSEFYQNHNVDVYCMAFDNRTSATPLQVYNYTRMMDVFYASKVLGYEYFAYQQPDFQYALDIFVPDVGTDLSNTYSTTDNVTYYRTYSNGVIYYNTSSHHGWQDDGRTFENVNLYINLHDDASAQKYDILVSDGLGTQYNYTYTTAGSGWAYNDYKITLNTSTQHTNGRYMIDVAGETGIAYLGLDTSGKTLQGLRSWYSTDSGATWSQETENYMYLFTLEVNDTKKASLDSDITGVTQTNPTSGRTTNLTLSGGSDFALPVWSLPLTRYMDTYYNLSYWNGSSYVLMYPQNTATCDSDNPTWNITTIGGESFRSCYESSGSAYTFRVAPPHLSDSTFLLYGNNVSNITGIQFLPATLYTNDTANCSGTFTDADGDSGTAWVKWYINTTANASSSVSLANGAFFNFTLAGTNFAKGDNVTCELWAGDGLANSSKTNTSRLVNNSAPVITLNHPIDNGITNDDTPWFEVNYSDADGDVMNATLFINGTGYGNLTGISGGRYNITANHSLPSANTYYAWYVNATDGGLTTQSTTNDFYYATYLVVNQSIFGVNILNETNYSLTNSYITYFHKYVYTAFINYTNATMTQYITGSLPMTYSITASGNSSRLSDWGNRDYTKTAGDLNGSTSGVTVFSNDTYVQINGSTSPTLFYLDLTYYVRTGAGDLHDSGDAGVTGGGGGGGGGGATVFGATTTTTTASSGGSSSNISFAGAKRYYAKSETVSFNVLTAAPELNATVGEVKKTIVNDTWLYTWTPDKEGKYEIGFTDSLGASANQELVVTGSKTLNGIKNVSANVGIDYKWFVLAVVFVAVSVIGVVALLFSLGGRVGKKK